MRHLKWLYNRDPWFCIFMIAILIMVAGIEVSQHFEGTPPVQEEGVWV